MKSAKTAIRFQSCGLVILAMFTLSMLSPASAAEEWVEAMKPVHAKFKGTPGTLLQFGDSLTERMEYWTPLNISPKTSYPKGSPEMDKAFGIVSPYLKENCWNFWKGQKYGNSKYANSKWADENAAEILEKLKPETALIMLGTHELISTKADVHEKHMRSLIKKCLDNGTVVILSTIPPQYAQDAAVKDFVEVQRKLAKEFKLPMIDLHAEIMTRRPGTDWNGAIPPNVRRSSSQVETLIDRDGISLSTPLKYFNDYTPAGLRCAGFNLRNYLSLMKYAEVIEKVLK